MIILALTNQLFHHENRPTRQLAPVFLQTPQIEALVDSITEDSCALIATTKFFVPSGAFRIENYLTYGETREDTQRVVLVNDVGYTLRDLECTQEERNAFIDAIAESFGNPEGLVEVPEHATPKAEQLNQVLRVIVPGLLLMGGFLSQDINGAEWVGADGDFDAQFTLAQMFEHETDLIVVNIKAGGFECHIRNTYPQWVNRWPGEGITLPVVAMGDGYAMNSDLSLLLPPPVAQLN